MTDISPEVSDVLQGCVRLHWTAREFYLVASVSSSRWGLGRLGLHFLEEYNDEGVHIESLIDRLEQMDIAVSFDHDQPQVPRKAPIELIRAALALERSALEYEKLSVSVCRDNGDEASAMLIARNLEGSEDSIKTYTGWLDVARLIGDDNFIANVMTSVE